MRHVRITKFAPIPALEDGDSLQTTDGALGQGLHRPPGQAGLRQAPAGRGGVLVEEVIDAEQLAGQRGAPPGGVR